MKNQSATCPDLALLEDPDQSDIGRVLQSRFRENQIYTRISDSALVAVNPYRETPSDHDLYISEYKDTMSYAVEPLPPHIFQLTNQAYLHMRRTAIDQSIILRGETSSGKSVSCHHILEHLIALSSSQKAAKLQKRLQCAQVVMEAFGHMRSPYNENSSGFGKLVEMQFNERGRLVGAKILDYLLEKRKIIRHFSSHNEGVFHVFYHLLAIDNEEEKLALSLDPHAIHAYLAPYRLDPNGAALLEELRAALQSLGIGKKYWTRMLGLLVCLMNLMSLQFEDDGKQQQEVKIKNPEKMLQAAKYLGVNPADLEYELTHMTRLINKDKTAMVLDAAQASEHRDELVASLYSLLFSWIIERINVKLCNDTIYNFIGVLDLPGPRTTNQASFDHFCINFACEKIHRFSLREVFENGPADLTLDGIHVPAVDHYSNEACIELLTGHHGLISTVNNYSTSAKQRTDIDMLKSFAKHNSKHPSFSQKDAHTFSVQHYSHQVTYNPRRFLEHNRNAIDTGFVALIKGGSDTPQSYNTFMVELFNHNNFNTVAHPKDAAAIMSAQQVNKPGRSPSMRRSKSTRVKQAQGTEPKEGEEEIQAVKQKDAKSPTVLGQLESSLSDLVTTLEETIPWFVYCISSNNTRAPNQFDPQKVNDQIRELGLVQLAKRLRTSFTVSFLHDEFVSRYAFYLNQAQVDSSRPPQEQCEVAMEIFGQGRPNAYYIGNTKIFLTEWVWRQLEHQIREAEKQEQRRRKEDAGGTTQVYGNVSPIPGFPRDMSTDMLSRVSFGSHTDLLSHSQGEYNDRRMMAEAASASMGLPMPYMAGGADRFSDNRSFASEDDYYDMDSYHASDAGHMELKRMLPNNSSEEQYEEPPSEKPTGVRRHWVNFVWVMTWWIPSKCMIRCGGMKRTDIQLAWREKLTLCMIIFFISAFMIWFLVLFGRLICPQQNVFSQSELQAHSDKNNAYVAIRGEVFDLTEFAPRHWASDVIPANNILAYGGTDASPLFPVQVSALCQGTTGSVSEYVSLDFNFNSTDPNTQYHDFRYSTDNYRPDWYFEQMVYLRQNYKMGTMGFTTSDVYKQATSTVTLQGINVNRIWAILNGSVYDLTFYTLGGRQILAPPGQTVNSSSVDQNFMADSVVDLFRQKSGTDISQYWDALPLSQEVKDWQQVCLRNLFYVGSVDNRNSPQCVFSTYLLLIVTVFLCLVIVFKFLAALRFGTQREPEELDKFIICQVPCYTEGEESLKKTIDSVTVQKYDDKRKLLFLICDGMIVGGGNDRPTPRIVLDILGVDPSIDPAPLSFLSVGEGQKQHNMGKVFSGLYECAGHVVPYIVVVKVGKPSERQKPGNRGKRDSQLILMRFLNKVHYDKPMTPLELEMFHQIKNVIGINPIFYEFVLMVDADTEVMPDGMNRMASALVHDSKIVGLCGETVLSNEKDTWVTMIQVYEYFISHHLIKAFESLFSTVTCLPGCFCMYRIRTPQKNQPLLISDGVIQDYQINKVDTLHMKNLLHLGEDRYLTTLILKHFPKNKTKFISDAKCATNAPDEWTVLLSQRRRWINSTIHNLGELVFLRQLCGFCCFSMRFIVMLDLISTLVQPAIVGYLIYLIYMLSTSTDTVPIMSIITIAGVYGLQMIIFIIHRKWEYIIWMIVSILAIPVFSFYIPIYSYWHFDDFSWGNTRVVLGEKGKKVMVNTDEGKFDPNTIPTMTWSEYEESYFAQPERSEYAESYYTYPDKEYGMF